MLNFHDVHYVISCPDYSYRPKDNFPEVVFLGRSNVGKSSLINSLCLTRVAFASKKAGKTRYLNYFLLDKKFYLVDAPGYGFTRYGSEEDEAFGHMGLSLASFPKESLPREKAKREGIASLADEEVLALVLSGGIRGKNALDLARELLQRYGGFSSLGSASEGSLMEIKGIKEAKALEIAALFEVARRAAKEAPQHVSVFFAFSFVYNRN